MRINRYCLLTLGSAHKAREALLENHGGSLAGQVRRSLVIEEGS